MTAGKVEAIDSDDAIAQYLIDMEKEIARGKNGDIFEKYIIHRYGFPWEFIPKGGKWDIPGIFNNITGYPVSIKYRRLGEPVYLADALRQYTVDEDFEMILAGADFVCGLFVVNIQHIFIERDQWKELWGDMPIDCINELRAFMKTFNWKDVSTEKKNHQRNLCVIKKNELCEGIESDIRLRNKITGGQARVHGELSAARFAEHFGVDLGQRMERVTIWGKEIILSDIKLNQGK
jgi:hypothetical protein